MSTPPSSSSCSISSSQEPQQQESDTEKRNDNEKKTKRSFRNKPCPFHTFCEEKQKELRKNGEDLTFDEVMVRFEPIWQKMSYEQTIPYSKKFEKDEKMKEKQYRNFKQITKHRYEMQNPKTRTIRRRFTQKIKAGDLHQDDYSNYAYNKSMLAECVKKEKEFSRAGMSETYKKILEEFPDSSGDGEIEVEINDEKFWI